MLEIFPELDCSICKVNCITNNTQDWYFSHVYGPYREYNLRNIVYKFLPLLF